MSLTAHLLVLSAKRSAPTTHLGSRLLWTLVVLLVIAGLWLLMWRGWRARGRRQADLPEPAQVPAERGAALLDPVEGIYVSTTRHGDWLDRVVVHGLGVRSQVAVEVTDRGVLLSRQGAPDVWLPKEDLVSVGTAPGMAGKFVGGDGLVVITWTLGTTAVDTGVRCDAQAARQPLLAALRGLVPVTEEAS